MEHLTTHQAMFHVEHRTPATGLQEERNPIMEQLLMAVPLPRTDGFGWGVICPVHRDLHEDTAHMDVRPEDAEAFAAAVRCGEQSHKTGRYPTGRDDGMSFIGNRWVFTGSQGYVVKEGTVAGVEGWHVHSFDATGTTPVYPYTGDTTWTGAHRRAFLLARRR